MNETQINAQFASLTTQRNNALNEVVLLSGRVAVLEDEIKSLRAQLDVLSVKKQPSEESPDV